MNPYFRRNRTKKITQFVDQYIIFTLFDYLQIFIHPLSEITIIKHRLKLYSFN